MNKSARQFVVVLVLTLWIRVVILWLLPTGLDIDTDGYRRIAIPLRTTGTYGVPVERDVDSTARPQVDRIRPTAYRPPLYPLLLSVFVRNGQLSPYAVAGLHVVL